MVGRVGADAFGDELLASLRADGVDVDSVQRDPDEPTGTALILVQEGGQNMIAVARGANNGLDEADVSRAMAQLQPGDILLLQLEIPLAAVASAARRAGAAGVRVILNAAPADHLDRALLSEIEVLVVNEVEAAMLLDRPAGDPAQAAEAARAGLALGARALVVTLGAAGAVLATEGRVSPLEPRTVAAVDTTAAGDAFVGALAAALATGSGLVEAAELAGAAGAAGAANVTRPGVQASRRWPEDLRRLFGIEWPIRAAAR